MPFLCDLDRNAFLEDFVDDMMKLCAVESVTDDSDSFSVSESGKKPPSKKKRKTLLGQLIGDMFDNQPDDRTVTMRAKAEQELNRYIDEPTLGIDDNLTALKWWKTNENRFPSIAKMAKSLLCIPTTSTPSERLFSTAGNIINKKRACLDAENVEMLCFLADNLPDLK